jgi:hypothetical protein
VLVASGKILSLLQAARPHQRRRSRVGRDVVDVFREAEIHAGARQVLRVLVKVRIAVIEVGPNVIVRDVHAAVEVAEHDQQNTLLGPRLNPALQDRDLSLGPATVAVQA